MVAPMRERDKSLNGRFDRIYDPIGGLQAVFRDKLPNCMKISLDFRMKIIPSHLMRSSPGRTLRPEPREYFSARDGLNSATFEIVVTSVKRLPRCSDIVKKVGDHVFHQLVARAATLAGHLVKLRLHLGFEMHFHAVSFLSDYAKRHTKAAPFQFPV
jgi:hypothetical protein